MDHSIYPLFNFLYHILSSTYIQIHCIQRLQERRHSCLNIKKNQFRILFLTQIVALGFDVVRLMCYAGMKCANRFSIMNVWRTQTGLSFFKIQIC